MDVDPTTQRPRPEPPEEELAAPFDPLQVAPPALDAAGPGGISWGGALGRAILRSALLAAVLAVALVLLTFTIGGVFLVVRGEALPDLAELLEVVGGCALGGLFGGMTLAPLALVEAVAATSDDRAKHLTATLLTIPLSLLAVVLVTLQATYMFAMFDSGSFERAADAVSEMLRDLSRIDLAPVLFICALLPSVPLTTWARLRRYAHRAQLGFVVPLTALAAAALCLLGVVVDRAPSDIWIAVALAVGTSCMIGALLPGAYLRGDQLERWAVRKLWPAP